MKRREIHEACVELSQEACTLSAAVDSLVAITKLRNDDRARREAYVTALEAEVSDLTGEVQSKGILIDDLLDQLRAKDEMLEQLRRDYDKDVDLLRETIDRQAKIIEGKVSGGGD